MVLATIKLDHVSIELITFFYDIYASGITRWSDFSPNQAIADGGTG